MTDFIDQFIQAHIAGTRERQAREQFAADLEERQWRRDMYKAEIKRQELEDKLKERLGQQNEAIRFNQAQQGSEGTVPQGTQMALPNVGANPGNQAFGLPGGPTPTPPSGITPPEAYQTIAPTVVHSAYGGPDISLPVHTSYQLQKIQDDIAAREVKRKRAEEHPFALPENSKGVFDPATNSIIPVPEAKPKAEKITNEVELFQKDPEAWAKMIKTKAALDHIMNPQQETDAKFQWRMFKSDPEAWKQVYGAGKKEDAGERLIKEYNLAEKLYPGSPDEAAAAAQRIHNIVDKARAGASDPFAGLTTPQSTAPPAASPGLFERIFGGGQAPTVPAPPPSVMPSQYDPAQLIKQGYKKVKGGWQKQK